MTNNNKLIKLKMISSKEICDSLHLVHFGKDTKVDSYTTLEQVKKNSVVFLKNNSEKSIKKLKKHRFSLLVLPESCAAITFLINDSSTNGPFLIDLDIRYTFSIFFYV